MKKFFFLASFLVITMATQAEIWRVNNNPGVVADATTTQAAHDMAAAGDTIHIEPSITPYPGSLCTKRLTWISTGSFLTENPGNQLLTSAAMVTGFTMAAGSQGSILSVYSTASIVINTNNISVIRSRVNSFINASTTPAFNTVISQCYVYEWIWCAGSNLVVTNNIAGYVATQSSGSGIISNNIFTVASQGGPALIHNSVFQNNIITTGNYSFINSIASYNMLAGSTGIPAGNNNIFNVNTTTIFQNTGVLPSRVDKDFMLKPGSPAIGAGEGGTDMGAFGGSTPFVLGLQPAVPAITALSSPAASSTNVINVTFSAKSNQ